MSSQSPEKKQPKSGYKVGYALPPEHTRFQAGNAGNKKGRPKGRPSFAQIVREEMARILKVPVGDKITHVEKDRLLVRKAVNEALKGNMQALKLALSLLAKSQEDAGVEPPPEEPLTKDELAVAALLAKAKGGL